ncbi:hypothetical protein LIER_00377 [Lithospermum erythrorhizon]|uniref:Uncharacterized protein n=1 Tax=Lithospermum erythrorhizon TaxID=34254 RepID=A0AAV3NLM5_LITER
MVIAKGQKSGTLYLADSSQKRLQKGSGYRKKQEDEIGEDAKPLTISDKLIKGKHVIDVEVNVADQSEPVPEGEAAGLLLMVYEEELLRVEAEIQAKTVLASKLKAKINALRTRFSPTVNASSNTPEPGTGTSASSV